MTRSENVILTNMCMIYDEYGKILVQDRLSKKWPGIAFPGGHVNRKESLSDSVIREVYEETGLKIKSPILCGIKQFQTIEDERYLVFLYKTNQFAGELTSSTEGNVFWINREDVADYLLADDFEQMLKVFESDDISELYYYSEDEQVQSKLL